jgi:uncharacterized SAM-binding protein YcdF (DUF218 family)
MAWFALARILIVAAVAYAAALLRPLPVNLPANIAFAAALAGIVVAFESRLRETAPDAHPRCADGRRGRAGHRPRD